jgi:phosphoglycolate phosphatase-like HAD superfamily hydrolase
VKRWRALILDFDGVVLESNDLKTRAFEAVFARFPEHHTAMMAYHHAHVSDSRYDKFRYLATERLGRPADDPIVDELAAALSSEMRQLITHCPWVPGAQDLIQRAARKVPVYVASMTPQHELDAVVASRGLNGMFAGVYGCPPWTKARAIGQVLDLVRARPDEVLFVGDSAGDQRVARATGVDFMARNSGLAFDHPEPKIYPDLTAITAVIADRLQ